MIIVSQKSLVKHGEGSVRSTYVLFADTKSEVPATGAATAALITDLDEALPPTTILYTASLEVAVLNTSDAWVWKE